MPGGDRGAEGYISKYFLKTPKIDNLHPLSRLTPSLKLAVLQPS